MNKIYSLKGFSLVKILIITAIVGILSVVAYTLYVDYKNNKTNEAFQSEMKEVKVAMELYKEKYDKYPNISNSEFGGGCGQSLDGAFLKATGVVQVQGIPLTLGCGYNDPVMAKMGEFIPEPLIIDHKNLSGNPDCELLYWVKEDLSSYKLIAHNCNAGADKPEEGVQAGDELAACPRRCLSCGHPWKAYRDFSNRDSSDFYNSYSIYSEDVACY